ncbi:MAG: hypothetical protein SGBAC_007456 [Bacillariaceae sp.]
MFSKFRRGSSSGMGKSKRELRERSSSTKSISPKRGSGRGVGVDHTGSVSSHSSRNPIRQSSGSRMTKPSSTRVNGNNASTPSPSAPPKERMFSGRKFGSLSPKAPSFRIFNRSASGKSISKNSNRESDPKDDFIVGDKTPTRKSPKPPSRAAYYTAPIDRSNRKVNSTNIHRATGLSFVPDLVDEQETYELDLPDVEVLETPIKTKGRSKKRSSRRRPPTSAPNLSPYPASPTDSSPPTKTRPTLSKGGLQSQSMRSPSPYSMTKDSMSQSMRSESPYFTKPKVELSQSMRSVSSTPAKKTKFSSTAPVKSRRQQKLDAERAAAEEFSIGQVVELHSLQNKVMNGRKGRVYGKKKMSDRYHIALFLEGAKVDIFSTAASPLEEEEDYVAIRPKNMRLATLPTTTTTYNNKETPPKVTPEKEKPETNSVAHHDRSPLEKEVANKKEPEKSVAHHDRSSFSEQVLSADDEDYSDHRVMEEQQPNPNTMPKQLSANSMNTSKHESNGVTVDDFQVGEWVQLQGLRTETMNGREGYVYGMSEDRLHVVIDQVGDVDKNLKNFMQDQDYVAIRPQNLVLLGMKKVPLTTKSTAQSSGGRTNKSRATADPELETLLSDSDWETDTDEEEDIAESARNSSRSGAEAAHDDDSEWETDTDSEEVADEATEMKSIDDNDERVIKADDMMESSDDDIIESSDEESSDDDDSDDEQSSIALEMISEKSDVGAPKRTTPPSSYKKKNSINKDTDATSITVDEIEEEEEESIDFEYPSSSDEEMEEELQLEDLGRDKESKTKKDNEKSQVLDWYHCSRMLSIHSMSSDDDDSSMPFPENDTNDEIAKMLSDDDDDGDDSVELVVNKPSSQRRKSKALEASSVQKNRFSVVSAVDKVQDAKTHEETKKDLNKKGLSHEIICEDDDDCSVITMSDESYMADLMSQIQQRSALREEELLEMAFDLFSHLANSNKDGQFDGQSEEMFLKMHQQVTAKHGPELKIRDDAKDRKLKHYLTAVHHKKY